MMETFAYRFPERPRANCIQAGGLTCLPGRPAWEVDGPSSWGQSGPGARLPPSADISGDLWSRGGTGWGAQGMLRTGLPLPLALTQVQALKSLSPLGCCSEGPASPPEAPVTRTATSGSSLRGKLWPRGQGGGLMLCEQRAGLNVAFKDCAPGSQGLPLAAEPALPSSPAGPRPRCAHRSAVRGPGVPHFPSGQPGRQRS